jgi:NAD(P)-dependent dehydrogenase (short-subunit alcohol dehydrogenase family)
MRSLTILITGATAGIGRHAALHLARAGHRVVATGRKPAALAALAAEAAGTKLETMELDVTHAGSIDAAVEEIARRTEGRGIDVLVNNAGYGLMGPLEEITDRDLRAQYDTNVFGLVAMIRAFVPQMRARGTGRVINVSSMGGRMTFPFMGAYNSTKYAVESLSDALRMELAPFGVSVSLIEPGAIKSDFAERAMATTRPLAASPYAPILSNAERMKKQFEATEVGPECVSRAIEKAATARRPRARYVAPGRTIFALLMMRLLPTSWTDRLLRVAVGLTRRKLGVGDGGHPALG